MAGINEPLFEKFTVYRNDHRDEPGGDRADARYFVLDYVHDPFAREALAAYVDEILTAANAHRPEYNLGGRGIEDRPFPLVPQLASDLMRALMDTQGADRKTARELVDTWIAREYIEKEEG